ncbi:MAG: hypothetical protein CTY31_00335 [Hyphomicrobium sp.]|nr:MAG: hypothetical protein CTY39_07690 [Hyphomicrobium sp.]PPD01280.1 MAG: hypothetical protein CTY31_00335 [Hyphomicrobium sp.]
MSFDKSDDALWSLLLCTNALVYNYYFIWSTIAVNGPHAGQALLLISSALLIPLATSVLLAGAVRLGYSPPIRRRCWIDQEEDQPVGSCEAQPRI